MARALARIQELQLRAGAGPRPGHFEAVLAAQLDATTDGEAAASTIQSLTPPVARPITIGELIGASGPVGRRTPAVQGIASGVALDDYVVVSGVGDRNGRLAEHELVEVSGGFGGRTGRLLPPAAAAWEEMRAAALADGIDLRFVDSYRSWEVQHAAHQRYLSGEKKEFVLPAGTSQHGFGLAVDLTDGALLGPGDPEWDWMNANAAAFGWHPISNESWHWEFRGA